MIILDYKDRRPIYEQGTEKLKELMFLGVLQENQPLPSVRILAMDLSINPNTIQRAYAELERQGYIYTVKGRGSFVAENGEMRENALREIWNKLEEVVEEALRLGISEKDLKEAIGACCEKAAGQTGGETHA